MFIKSKKRKIKVYNYVGLCLNERKYNVHLSNIIKLEKIQIKLDLRSPIIIKFCILKNYAKRSKKIIKSLKVGSYYDDYNNKNGFLYSNIKSIKLDFMHLGYLKRRLKRFKKKMRKFKKKYYYTENWKNLRVYFSDYKDFLIENDFKIG